MQPVSGELDGYNRRLLMESDQQRSCPQLQLSMTHAIRTLAKMKAAVAGEPGPDDMNAGHLRAGSRRANARAGRCGGATRYGQTLQPAFAIADRPGSAAGRWKPAAAHAIMFLYYSALACESPDSARPAGPGEPASAWRPVSNARRKNATAHMQRNRSGLAREHSASTGLCTLGIQQRHRLLSSGPVGKWSCAVAADDLWALGAGRSRRSPVTRRCRVRMSIGWPSRGIGPDIAVAATAIVPSGY